MKQLISGSSIKAAGLVAMIVFATGCASTSEVEEANATAQRALETAQQAQRTAEEAKRQAEAAEQCCKENQQKIDRAFERSQYK